MLVHHPQSTTFFAIGLIAVILLNAAWFLNYHNEIHDACITKLDPSSTQFQRPHFDNDLRLAESETTDLDDGELELEPERDETQVNWSHFAYLQYITAAEHACNSVMVFEALHRLGSKAQRVLLYPQDWGDVNSVNWAPSSSLDRETRKILLKTRDEYHVILKPVDLIRQEGQDSQYFPSVTF